MKWKQSIWCRQNSYRRCHSLIYQEKSCVQSHKIWRWWNQPYFRNHKRQTIPLFPFLSHNIYLGKQKDVNFGCHKKEPTTKLRKGAISGMRFYGNYKWAQRLCVCFKFYWAFFSLMRILTIYVRQWSEACATTNNTLNKCNQQMSWFQFLFHLLQNVVPLVLCLSVISYIQASNEIA